jgi:GT2 family glycosyltransferase
MLYIILPVHNRIAQTDEFLRSLYTQSYLDFKVIVVDDGSNDDTYNHVAKNYPDCIILHGTGNLFWGGAINLGLEYVKSTACDDDFIAFANNDIVFLNSNSLNSLVLKCTKDSQNIYHSLVVNKNNVCMSSGSRLISWPFFLTHHPYRGENLENVNSNFQHWVNLATARFLIFNFNILKINDQIDSRFPHYLGDVDFSYNLYLKKGIKTIIDVNSIICLNVDSTGLNVGKINSIQEFIESLFSIRSSNNIIYRLKFGLKNCNVFLVPFYIISTIVKLIILNIFIKNSSH